MTASIKYSLFRPKGQAYRQAGNGVTVNVVEAIGKRLAAIDAELCGG